MRFINTPLQTVIMVDLLPLPASHMAEDPANGQRVDDTSRSSSQSPGRPVPYEPRDGRDDGYDAGGDFRDSDDDAELMSGDNDDSLASDSLSSIRGAAGVHCI